jgi:chemotaxis regulatin CheY-phosphate phosphatase CheZ
MRNLSPQMMNAIKANVPLIDVIHGELNNLMVEWQNKKFEDHLQDWADGYQDCLTDLYSLCYDVIFYKQDLDYKFQQETGRDNV